MPGWPGRSGHVRLFEDWTRWLTEKSGSYEGYVSGGGIAQYGKGTAAELGKRAEEGDPEALADLERRSGEHLGKHAGDPDRSVKSGGDRHRKHLRRGPEKYHESGHGSRH